MTASKNVRNETNAIRLANILATRLQKKINSFNLNWSMNENGKKWNEKLHLKLDFNGNYHMNEWK